MTRRSSSPFSFEAVIELFAPSRCPACGSAAALLAGAGLCAGCRAALARQPPQRLELPGDGLALGAIAAVPYVPPATGLVAALKSGRVPAVAATAAELIAEALPGLPAGAVLIPVGAAPLRRLRRGLDPAAEIAIALAARTGAGCEPELLRRRGRRPQRGRTRARRLAEPPRFELRAPAPRPPLVPVLVDDVLTTGATLASCARALSAAGAPPAAALTLAWAPAPGERIGR